MIAFTVKIILIKSYKIQYRINRVIYLNYNTEHHRKKFRTRTLKVLKMRRPLLFKIHNLNWEPFMEFMVFKSLLVIWNICIKTR